MSRSLQTMTKKIVAFRDARDWKQFHNPKDMAISLLLEAAEVAEHMQWRSKIEFEKHLRKNSEAVGDELVDVLYWVLLMAHDFKVNLPEAFDRKMKKNGLKYPVNAARGKATKYTELVGAQVKRNRKRK